jgi:hypothetical protein
MLTCYADVCVCCLQLKELNLDLEETFIMRLLDAAQNVVDSSTITVPDEKQEDLRSSRIHE